MHKWNSTKTNHFYLHNIFRNIGELYGGKELLSVHDWNPKDKSPIDIVQILLKSNDEDRTCKVVPNCISHNACFLLDTTSLQSENDWKSDDMASWRNNGIQQYPYVLIDNNMNLANKVVGDFEKYILKRTYYKNNSSPDVKRIVSTLKGMTISSIACNRSLYERCFFLMWLSCGARYPKRYVTRVHLTRFVISFLPRP